MRHAAFNPWGRCSAPRRASLERGMPTRRPSAFVGTVTPLLLIAMPASAQQQDEQVWLQVNTNVPVAPNLRLTLEQIGRFGAHAGGLFQTEFGGILGWRVAKGVELGFGYRKVGAHNSSAADENRIRQQVVAGFGHWVTRLRVDERFNSRGDEIGFRIRPLLRYNHPVGKGTALFASHESFILPNSASWGQRRGYERMRNLVGVTLPLGPLASADVGYLNRYRFARAGARAQMDHALSLQLTINVAAVHHAPKVDD